VIPSAFAYERATSVDDALAKLAATNGAGRLIAGGHSLVPLMKLRLTEPATLIDIARIPGLAGVRDVDGAIEVGAGTVHRDVATSSLLRQQCPVMAETAGTIGDPQVRNRGTLGGSLAHADPAADYPAVMLAVDAKIHLQSSQGPRVVPARDFFQDLFTVDLAPDEIITAVRFAPVRAAAYAKLYQRASRFAIVGVAAALEVADGVIRSARVGLTGAVSHAVRLTAVEESLAGRQPTPEVVAEAAQLAASDLEDIAGDLHASATYRRAMVPVFAKRALDGALARLT
jgi:carbon-monoxide dehydrogenase medium subunit